MLGGNGGGFQQGGMQQGGKGGGGMGVGGKFPGGSNFTRGANPYTPAGFGPGMPSSQGGNPGTLKGPMNYNANGTRMGDPQMISDPYRDYGRPPTMGGPTMSKPFTVNQPAPQGPQALPDGTQMISDPYREYGRPPQLAQSGPMPQQPQMIPGTNRPMPPGAFIDQYGIARRAPETPMNPGAGQFGQYTPGPNGFTLDQSGGLNRINGTLFSAEGLNQGGIAAPNYVDYLNRMFRR